LTNRHSGPRRVFGVDFPSVVGLAAGVDKDGIASFAWGSLGFGFAELGTVTALPQPGNPQPRLFRIPRSQAVINRMGFNNSGAAELARTLRAARPAGIPLGISLGKSKVTPTEKAVGDYLTSLRAVHGLADYIAVNVSSPNTPGLRSLQDRGPLDELLGAMTEEAALLARAAGSSPVPVLVKISPDLTDHAVGEVLQVCADRNVAGIIATNTTLSREDLPAFDRGLADEPGGLSGAPLRRRAREVVGFVATHTELPVIGVGGVMSVDDGLALLDSGASLLQVYTGFIYAGPGLVTGLNKAIAARERSSR
jgi:dihydroorotate dehydrogenase